MTFRLCCETFLNKYGQIRILLQLHVDRNNCADYTLHNKKKVWLENHSLNQKSNLSGIITVRKMYRLLSSIKQKGKTNFFRNHEAN